jgi:fatty acid desaturase
MGSVRRPRELVVAARRRRVLAVAFAQVGFLGHDAGRRQVFRTRRANDVLGILCGNLATGLSYGWWTGKHNRHHAHPNTEGADPDIMISVLAFSGSQARASRGIQRLAFATRPGGDRDQRFAAGLDTLLRGLQADERLPGASGGS